MDAIGIVVEGGQASVSMLQRRLKLGYSRAARLVDQMEERGIVGPFEGSKPRTVTITREEWWAIYGGLRLVNEHHAHFGKPVVEIRCQDDRCGANVVV